MSKEIFKTSEHEMQGQNKEVIRIKDEKLMLWREVDGRQLWGRIFKANVIKLKMKFETQI